MKTTRVPIDHCPWCGYEVDAVSPIEGDATPKPGDFSLCLKCASVLQFGPDLRIQKVSDQAVREALSAEGYSELMRARRAALSIDRREVGKRRRK